jgi:hypothetical protein
MEKTDVSIEREEQVPEESKKAIEQVNDDVPKKIEESIDEVRTTDNNVETNDDEIVPSTTPKPVEEQENVIDTNTVVPTSISPGQLNVSFKEVNESATTVNGTENINSKKRELDNEDEQIQEKILDNDERTGDHIKKIKTSESTDIPPIETKELENSIVVNGTSTVEV